MNSLNYVSTIAEVDFYKEDVSSTEKNLRSLKVVGIAWGFQRNYPKRFSLDLSFGLGYAFSKQTTINDAGEYITENTGSITNIGQIGLGFWLNKRD